MMRACLFLILIAMASAAPAPAQRTGSEHGFPPEDRVLERMILARRVVLYRMIDWNHIRPGGRSLRSSRMIRGNEAVDSTAVPLEWARRLVPIVANPSAWNAPLRKGVPELVAVVRYMSPSDTTDVELCFEDDAIGVHSSGWPARFGRSENERVKIIRWLQAAFPGEDRIEGLRERFKGYDYDPARVLRATPSHGWKVVDAPDPETILVKVRIDSMGTPRSCERVLGSVAGESSAVRTVLAWTFAPARRGKTPVEGWATFLLERDD
jgi:hypothetical protein